MLYLRDFWGNYPMISFPYSRAPQVTKKDGIITIKCELPGVEKEQIAVEIEGKYLSVKAPDYSYETYVGDVKPWGAKAEYKNGVLTVTLPQVDSIKVPIG